MRLIRSHPPAVHVVVPLVACTAAFLDQPAVDSDAAAWWLLAGWGAVSLLGLVGWQRRPVASVVAVFLVLFATEAIASVAQVSLTFLTIAPVSVAMFGVGLHAGPRTAYRVAALLGVVTLGGLVVNELTAPAEWRIGTDALAALLPPLAALAAGLATRTERVAARSASDRLRAERQERVEVERLAADAERRRIARDMHDVVAHSVALLVVHAEAMRARAAELPPWARERVDAMARDGRRAADEMRDLLGVLGARSGGDARPLPRFAEIDELVRASVDAGVEVSRRVLGTPEELTRQVELITYRFVQECLTNANKYAPTGRVELLEDWTSGDLRLRVVSFPEATGDGAGGWGLAGLRERLREVGGVLDVTVDRAGGRHIVECRVPTRAGAVRA